MKKILALMCAFALSCLVLVGCGGSGNAVENKTGLEPGEYTVTVKTDSTMFAVNEYYNGHGTLTVTKDAATLHVTLRSTGICNLYLGKAEDAKTSGAVLLEHGSEMVDWKDGTKPKEAYTFDIPISELGKEFACAIKGTDSGKWYDHTIAVSDPQPVKK